MKRFTVSLITLIIILAVWVTMAFSASYNITFGWDANNEPDLAGYRLYFSPSPGVYNLGDPNDYIVIPKDVIEHEVQDFQAAATQYFVLTAFDNFGNESGPSNEVIFIPDPNAPSGPSGFKIKISVTVQVIP